MRLAAMLAAGIVAFASCSDQPDESPRPTAASTSAPTATEAATTINVEIKFGKVVGGMERVKVPLDDEVKLSVISDVADEVHVHGYEEKEDVPAGGGILMTFDADVPGVFVVELEELGLHIVELEVR